MRNFSFTVAAVDGATIHLEGSNIDIAIPTTSYNQVRAFWRLFGAFGSRTGGYSIRLTRSLISLISDYCMEIFRIIAD